ncbi:MAG: M48 family metallopeptidase [Candidatus Margulisiibacteriota bacterium]
MKYPKLIRSNRRSVCLIVTEKAELVIRAPHRFPEARILRFVEQKRRWIERKIAEISSRPRRLVLSQAEKQAWRELARNRIPERCKYFSDLTGLRPRSIRITEANKRWGSCGARGGLNFSWRLILAPPEVIDYVIVHELVHLVERNHSKHFWRRVAEVLPDYKIHRRWLKVKGYLLSS